LSISFGSIGFGRPTFVVIGGIVVVVADVVMLTEVDVEVEEPRARPSVEMPVQRCVRAETQQCDCCNGRQRRPQPSYQPLCAPADSPHAAHDCTSVGIDPQHDHNICRATRSSDEAPPLNRQSKSFNGH
jgi:hypothetical protein